MPTRVGSAQNGDHACRCGRGADNGERKHADLEAVGRKLIEVDELLHMPKWTPLTFTVGFPEKISVSRGSGLGDLCEYFKVL